MFSNEYPQGMGDDSKYPGSDKEKQNNEWKFDSSQFLTDGILQLLYWSNGYCGSYWLSQITPSRRKIYICIAENGSHSSMKYVASTLFFYMNYIFSHNIDIQPSKRFKLQQCHGGFYALLWLKLRCYLSKMTKSTTMEYINAKHSMWVKHDYLKKLLPVTNIVWNKEYPIPDSCLQKSLHIWKCVCISSMQKLTSKLGTNICFTGYLIDTAHD